MAHRKLYYTCDVRDPYMGNTIPVKIEIRLGEEVYTGLHDPNLRVLVTNGEGMTMEARPVDPPDVHRMNT
jgi:hypothetical protein